MRSPDLTQSSVFSDRTLESRIPTAHPLRKLRLLVDAILETMDNEFDALYAATGRPSIPPECLLRASLIQTLFSIRSERQLVQHIDFHLLYRWFVGLDRDDAVWDRSVFTKNRGRLLNEAVSRSFFGQVLALAEWQGLVSSERFTVDGTLIEAWVSMKSFVPQDGSGKPPEDGGKNSTVDFKGETRSNDTLASTTDPDARLCQKAAGEKSRRCYLGHALMENRNGLAGGVETTRASGTAERGAAKAMVARAVTSKATPGADKGYDAPEFAAALRERQIAPHVVQKKSRAIDGRTTWYPDYKQSLKKRKLVEEIFGWAKTVGGLRKTRFIGLAKVKAQTVFTFAAYHLTRMATIFGWRLNRA